jgi:hypothetical protein
LNSENKKHAELILVENGNREYYHNYLKTYQTEKNLSIIFCDSPNKSKCLNEVVQKLTDNSLIICIDNDIEFPDDFIAKYNKTAKLKGNKYYFGGALIVPDAYNKLINQKFLKLYQGSQLSRSDEDFISFKNGLFFGANFAFFKSQWTCVKGFDERFSPGSKYKLAGQESVFQKKLNYVGFQQYFIKNNPIVHYPEVKSYQLNAIKKRTKQNGTVHGVSKIINSDRFMGLDYFKSLLDTFKKTIGCKLTKQKGKYIYRKYYSIGFMNALFIYFKLENKKSIFHDLKKLNL